MPGCLQRQKPMVKMSTKHKKQSQLKAKMWQLPQSALRLAKTHFSQEQQRTQISDVASWLGTSMEP
jgi:hypothetical protein